jgi:Tfp pilus assembly protein PilX
MKKKNAMNKNIETALRLKNSEKGFALIAAIMACLILLALGMLVASMSTQDIRISTKIVGDKKALAAAEEGVQNLMQTFDPDVALYASSSTTYRGVDGSSYTTGIPTRPSPSSGPWRRTIPGNDSWVRDVYIIDVTGTNPEYNTRVAIGVGAGFAHGSSGGGIGTGPAGTGY